MPRYRCNMFVQHHEDDPHTGCHVTVVVEARSPDLATPLAMHEAVTLCMEHHPGLGMPWRPITKQKVEMKPLKEAKKS